MFWCQIKIFRTVSEKKPKNYSGPGKIYFYKSVREECRLNTSSRSDLTILSVYFFAAQREMTIKGVTLC